MAYRLGSYDKRPRCYATVRHFQNNLVFLMPPHSGLLAGLKHWFCVPGFNWLATTA